VPYAIYAVTKCCETGKVQALINPQNLIEYFLFTLSPLVMENMIEAVNPLNNLRDATRASPTDFISLLASLKKRKGIDVVYPNP
jgi:hypothetical protein